MNEPGVKNKGQAADTGRPSEIRMDKTARPGSLQAHAVLTVETRQAQLLVLGRKSGYRSSGLFLFSGRVRPVWQAAARDDPYADWLLLQLQAALERAHRRITDAERDVRQSLERMRGIEITIAQSRKPLKVPLQFATPFGYMGAYLIADYDSLVRAVFTAEHTGVLHRREGAQLIHHTAGTIRHAFQIPRRWRHCAVTRRDIRQNNRRAQTARAAMGNLPQAVLDGTHRALRAPPIRTA